MGLPISTALFGSGSAAVMAIASNGFTIPEFGPEIAAMIGLGVGIDYALFIVTRYREQLHSGMEPEEAVIRAVDSSGRAVIFAGLTVMISLLGLFIISLSFVRGLAAASAITVLIMMIASITLLPASSGSQVIASTRPRGQRRSRRAFVVLSLIGVFTDVPLGLALLGAFAIAIIVMVASVTPFGGRCAHSFRTVGRSRAPSSTGIGGAGSSSRRPWPPLILGSWCCWCSPRR